MKAVGCILQHGVRRVSAVSALHPYALPFAPRLVFLAFLLRVLLGVAVCTRLAHPRCGRLPGACGVSAALRERGGSLEAQARCPRRRTRDSKP